MVPKNSPTNREARTKTQGRPALMLQDLQIGLEDASTSR